MCPQLDPIDLQIIEPSLGAAVPTATPPGIGKRVSNRDEEEDEPPANGNGAGNGSSSPTQEQHASLRLSRGVRASFDNTAIVKNNE